MDVPEENAEHYSRFTTRDWQGDSVGPQLGVRIERDRLATVRIEWRPHVRIRGSLIW